MDCCAKIILLLAVIASAGSTHFRRRNRERQEEAAPPAPAHPEVPPTPPSFQTDASVNLVRNDGTSGDGGYVNLGIVGVDEYPSSSGGIGVAPYPLDFVDGPFGEGRRTVVPGFVGGGGGYGGSVVGLPIGFQGQSGIVSGPGGGFIYPNEVEAGAIRPLFMNVRGPGNVGPAAPGLHTNIGVSGPPAAPLPKEKDEPKGPLAGLLEGARGPLHKLLSEGPLGKFMKNDDKTDKEGKPLAGILGKLQEGGNKGQWGIYLGKILVDALSTFVTGTQKVFSGKLKD